jgi:YHS domain-containing protein
MQPQDVLYFLLWAGFFFLMMRFGCGSHIMGHSHHHRSDSDDGHNATSHNTWQQPGQNIDPVCRRSVDTATAKSAAYQGHIYYFCSQDCREKFEAAPASYAPTTTSVPQTEEHRHHGCC